MELFLLANDGTLSHPLRKALIKECFLGLNDFFVTEANEYIYESDYKKIIAIYAKSIYDLTK